jgi:hypothetical protein
MDTSTRLAMAKQAITTFTGNEMQNTILSDFPSGEFDIGVPKPFTSQWNNAVRVKRNPPVRAGGFVMNAKSGYTREIARLLDIGFALQEVAPGTGLYGDAFTYGPEGLSWQLTNPEKTQFDFTIPAGLNVNASTYQYDYVIYNSQGMPRTLTNAVTAEKSNNRTRQLEFLENLNPNSTTDFFPVNFLKFTEEEQAVIDKRYTDINTYMGEMRAKFITGVANIDAERNTYVKTINDMDIAEVIKAYQAAYDRWNKL